LRDVNPAEVYPRYYTDAKGNGWRDHWYNTQLKQLQIAEEVEANIHKNFTFAVQAATDRIQQESVDSVRNHSESRRRIEQFNDIEKDASPNNRRLQSGKHTPKKLELYEAGLLHKQIVTTKRLHEESKLKTQIVTGYDGFKINEELFEEDHMSYASSISKSHMMAKLTFDAEFRKQYFAEQR
jgi:hypothetical protein